MRKKIDNRIRVLIENCVQSGHRSLIAIVGEKAKDQVVLVHHMLSKASVKARPSVLWCYKKELAFSSHRKKKMKQIERKIKSGTLDVNEDNPFELFVASTNIRYAYYHETHKILGNTYGMCVLQDFEALTPNLLARTIETVEGGGAIVILLKGVSSLKQLYTMTMDVHSRYRTESHKDVVNRFNERFILSLANNHASLFLDDKLNILPISSHIKTLEKSAPGMVPVSDHEPELAELKSSLQDTQPVGSLVNCCRTLDQAKSLLKFIEAISEKSLRSTVSLTAARGRGKSAALGLAIAAAVGFGYSNIFVTSPSPENLHTLFDFVFKGFDALNYEEHMDYELVQSTNPEFNKAVVRVNIFHDHRQTIQYIHPGDAEKLSQAELVVIDEAAAIPLPLVKKLLGPYLVFMASTINGYEGTGRSLSLKLLDQLRQQSSRVAVTANDGGGSARTLQECELKESIRYRSGDEVEKWLNSLLCLEANNTSLPGGTPLPQDCNLYYINRDTLFSYHSASEEFLHRIMALFVASHYKNSPNDLQMLSDAPAHHIFCLLGPISENSTKLPEVLCVVQVCLEGEISKGSIMAGLRRGQRASGDLIPWTMAQQFQDDNFPQLSGARIVRIATHPEYQRMGYGSRTIQLLQKYYEGEMVNLNEKAEGKTDIPTVEEEDLGLLEEALAPRKNLPPLLLELGERPPEELQYLGVSFGLTANLLRFWKKAGFVPTYLRQTRNALTGEHTNIMLKALSTSKNSEWLSAFFTDFRRRVTSLLGYELSSLSPSLALSIMHNKLTKTGLGVPLTPSQLSVLMTPYDVKRLEMYSNNLADHHLITDLVPALARCLVNQQLGQVHMSPIQQAILVGLGLQHKTVDTLTVELELPANQLLALFNKAIKKLSAALRTIIEQEIESRMDQAASTLNTGRSALSQVMPDLDQELEEGARLEEMKQLNKAKQAPFISEDLSKFAIKGSDDDWKSALKTGVNVGNLSVKTGEKRPLVDQNGDEKTDEDKFLNKKKPKKKSSKRN
jgi:N-acetyltransferase 10